MSILNLKESFSEDGIRKTIESESMDVAIDILQRGIYAYPMKSTIRELASNAYDANKEREVAKKILLGTEKVEDHYDVTKVDGIYHSSGWDPDYYDVKYLSDDPNIYLLYEEGTQKDILRIKDNGIGLGKDRLVGYFRLNFSSKRAQRGALGRYGLGSKAALSLNIDSFTVINHYNGKKFRFEVYLNNVVSATPKFSNGKINNHITVTVPQPSSTDEIINKDFIFYYEDTNEQNGLELVIPIKKYEQKECFRAIEEQLMYIPNIIFTHQKQNEFVPKHIDIAAKVLYRDENIVISESTLLDYPHILLGTGEGLVNYNKIDFQALELEPKKGAVGLILNINDVEVTPSREAVVWSTKTRAAVIDSYNKIVDTATKLINNELNNASDYWDWLQKVGSIKNALVTNQAATGTVLQKLSGIIDASAINKIYYRKDGMNKLYVSDIKEMIGEKLLVRLFSYDRYSRSMKRDKIKSIGSISGVASYITSGSSDKYRDRYIFEQVERKAFVVIKRLENWNLENTSNLISKSSILKDYDSVIVPENFMDLYLKDEVDSGNSEDDESVSVAVDSNRLARLRKLEQKVLFHKPKFFDSISYTATEVKISDIMTEYADQLVIYGAFDSRSLINSVIGLYPFSMLEIMNKYRIPHHISDESIYSFIVDYLDVQGAKKINAILISKENKKYLNGLNNFQYITEYMIESYKSGKLVFNKSLRIALTFKTISKIISKYNIPFPSKDLLLEGSVYNLYTKEFLQIYIASEFFNSSSTNTVDLFFNNAISYEMGKNKVDDSILNDYLRSVESLLPEELCGSIDEITDIHIVDVDLINKTYEYCELYKKYNPILKGVKWIADVDIINILDPLIKGVETFPKELGIFN